MCDGVRESMLDIRCYLRTVQSDLLTQLHEIVFFDTRNAFQASLDGQAVPLLRINGDAYWV